jgi:hypothetical protein
MITLKHVVLSFVLLAAAIVGSVGSAAASTTAAAPYCGITWGSLPKEHGDLTPSALVDVRTGRHDCYDRVVFEFQGSAQGYRVEYADVVATQARNEPLDIAGGAKLNVLLTEPANDVNTGAPTYLHRSGDHVANVNGYRTLRDVVYGNSYEGYTTFGVGTRARLPFRVFTLDGPGSHSRIVIDIANQWS